MTTKRHSDSSGDEFPGPVFGAASHCELALRALVAQIEGTEREIRALEAKRLEQLAQALDLAAIESTSLRGDEDVSIESSTPKGDRAELAYRAVRAEVACALHLSEATVERRMSSAWELTHSYRAVFDAYRYGEISEQHARVITDAGRVIGTDNDVDSNSRRADYAEQVLTQAVELSPNRLRPIAQRLAEQYAEVSLDERHEQAATQRSVWIREAADGMAELTAYLPAAEAYGIYSRITKIGRVVVESGGARGRSRNAIRADVLSDILRSGDPVSAQEQLSGGVTELADAPQLAGIHGDVQVLIPSQLLTGDQETNAAAMMQGYGPIDTETARMLAGDAQAWEMILAQPATGEVLQVDRYRPTVQMKRMLRARDQHCRFPGCRVPLARCDIDHTIDAALGGPTATNNLAHLCRGHHTLKHHTGWRVEQQSAGELEWTSPAGKKHRDRPPSTVTFTATLTEESADSADNADSADRAGSGTDEPSEIPF